MIPNETKALLEAVRLLEMPKLHQLTPAAAREQIEISFPALDLPSGFTGEVTNIEVPGPAGAIASRLYMQAGKATGQPVIAYFHGGGWVVGSIDIADQLCRHMAERLCLRVLSVGYRKAPEHVFPAAFEDCLAAADWLAGSPPALGGPVSGVVVAGDSAGGNLAAAVSAGAATRPLAQLLFYPVMDLSRQSPSYSEFAEGYLLGRAEMEWFRDLYVPDVCTRGDPRVSPLLAENFVGLPPSVIMTCGLDVLRDEGRAYAAKLVQAGVRVSFSEAEGLIHGIANFRRALPSGAVEVDRALDSLAGILKELGVLD